MKGRKTKSLQEQHHRHADVHPRLHGRQVQDLAGPRDDVTGLRPGSNKGPEVNATCLALGQRLPTHLAHVAVGCVQGVVVRHRARCVGTLAIVVGIAVAVHQNDAVLEKVVNVASALGVDAKARVDVGIEIVVVVVVVAAEVILHAAVSIHKHVVVRLVVGRAVVVVHSLLPVIIAHKEIIAQLIVSLDDAGRAVTHLRHIHLAVPAVEGPVVARLHDGVEEKIALEQRPASKAVIEINAGAGAVEEDVILDCVLAAACLEVEGRLLLKETTRIANIAHDASKARLCAGCSIRAKPKGLFRCPCGPAQLRDDVVANLVKVVVLDGGIAVVVFNQHSVTVELDQRIGVKIKILTAEDVDGGDATKAPVATAGYGVSIKVGQGCVAERDAANGDTLDWVFHRAVQGHQGL
eukprot:m.224628 g.224628  ORF g.224628 m.224628 type:complete len:408 (+) comp16516_c0_seq1:98-1321(+)